MGPSGWMPRITSGNARQHVPWEAPAQASLLQKLAKRGVSSRRELDASPRWRKLSKISSALAEMIRKCDRSTEEVPAEALERI